MSLCQIWCFYHKRHNSYKILQKPAGRLRYLNSAFPILGDYVASILCSFFYGMCILHSGIGHFRVPKTLTFKMRPGAGNLSCQNEFYLLENVKWFPYQRLSTYSRFEAEARGNSEMALFHVPCFIYGIWILHSLFWNYVASIQGFALLLKIGLESNFWSRRRGSRVLCRGSIISCQGSM